MRRLRSWLGDRWLEITLFYIVVTPLMQAAMLTLERPFAIAALGVAAFVVLVLVTSGRDLRARLRRPRLSEGEPTAFGRQRRGVILTLGLNWGSRPALPG
jgi:hypothetical protein